jgi:hypothetical protein
MQGFDITPDLRRMCPGLTLAQVYKLTEHHHDDWITGGASTDTLVLLQTLKRTVDAHVRAQSPPCMHATPCSSLHHLTLGLLQTLKGTCMPLFSDITLSSSVLRQRLPRAPGVNMKPVRSQAIK